MRVFVAGIMQGSMQDRSLHRQDYRRRIREPIQVHHPEAEIVDPFSLFPDSAEFDDAQAKEVLFQLAAEAAASDLVIAFLPQASMGTALEMIRAYDNGKPIVTITPMENNWLIRAMSAEILPSLEAFDSWASQADLSNLIDPPESWAESEGRNP